MQSKKLFLNPELKITDVSRISKLPRRQISQTINEKLGVNFYHYVNRFRIEEAIHLMEKEEFSRYSIAGISELAGFKSRSSFYKAFKEQTGHTPVDYFKLCVKTATNA